MAATPGPYPGATRGPTAGAVPRPYGFFGPGRQTPGRDSCPPVLECPPRTKFSKSIEGEIADTPRVMGPRPKILKAKSGRVIWPWWGDLWTSLARTLHYSLAHPWSWPLDPWDGPQPRCPAPSCSCSGGGHTSPCCILELSIEIFAYLWDKEFIWIKLPLSSGGNNESKYRNSRDALRVQLGFCIYPWF
jgi:hypothetical protein